jgi:hypothetical protein
MSKEELKEFLTYHEKLGERQTKLNATSAKRLVVSSYYRLLHIKSR